MPSRRERLRGVASSVREKLATLRASLFLRAQALRRRETRQAIRQAFRLRVQQGLSRGVGYLVSRIRGMNGRLTHLPRLARLRVPRPPRLNIRGTRPERRAVPPAPMGASPLQANGCRRSSYGGTSSA